jgi:4-amino-4-deoxy-L-arabinose transferase-like glycosyltransferase
VTSRVAALGLVVLCVAVALWDLGGRSVYERDVPRFGTIAREMVRGGDWLVPTQYGHVYANKPILYVWAVALPSKIAGDVSETWIRLPSALGLLMATFAAWIWTSARTGGRAFPSHLAALTVLTTFFVNELGRTGRPDMLAAGFGSLAAALVDRSILGRGKRLDPVWAGLALGGGLLSKGPVVFLVPLFLVLLPRRDVARRERCRRARPGLVALLAVGTTLLWLGPAIADGGLGYAKRLVWDQIAERVSAQANHIEPLWYYLRDLPVVMLPWTPVLALGGLAFASRRVRGALGDGAHAAAAGAALLALSLVPTKEVRYASIVVAPLAVAAAQATEWLVGGLARPGAWRRLATGVGVLAIAGAGFLSWFVLAKAPSALLVAGPWALALAGTGAATVWAVRRADATDAGRAVVRLAVLSAACVCPWFWSVLPRHGLPVFALAQNRRVLEALEPDVPTVVLASDPAHWLTPDDLFYVMARADYAPSPDRIPSRAVAPRLAVVSLSDRVADADAARGEPSRETLRFRDRDGRDVVVLRYGP